jgi:hypothetical protein
MLDGYKREQIRQQYVEAWRRRQERLPLSPLETLIADVIELHPEYQALLTDAEEALHFDAGSAAGGDAGHNPFLHMGLHIAVREQLAIDRPPGIVALHRALCSRFEPHAAEHRLVEALAETLFEAQQAHSMPDERRYLALARGKNT